MPCAQWRGLWGKQGQGLNQQVGPSPRCQHTGHAAPSQLRRHRSPAQQPGPPEPEGANLKAGRSAAERRRRLRVWAILSFSQGQVHVRRSPRGHQGSTGLSASSQPLAATVQSSSGVWRPQFLTPPHILSAQTLTGRLPGPEGTAFCSDQGQPADSLALPPLLCPGGLLGTLRASLAF